MSGSITYQNCQVVPVQPVASQQISATLNNQAVLLNIYTRGGFLYMDVFLAGNALPCGVICQNENPVVRDAYWGLVGDFAFFDTEGSDDPVYTGLGSRWLLGYFF